MITTGFESRVKVQQIIENQLPEFLLFLNGNNQSSVIFILEKRLTVRIK